MSGIQNGVIPLMRGIALSAVAWVLGVIPVHASPVQFVDQNGQPLANVVVIVPTVSAAPTTAPVIMDQVQKSFSPHVLTMPKGQFVSFPNSDNIRHHVYSFSEARPFEIRLYSGVPSQPLLFDKPGIVVLGCNIHDSMLGYIVVTDHQWSAVTNAAGEVDLPQQSNPVALLVWHPRQQGEANALHSLIVTSASRVTFPVEVPAEKPIGVNSFRNQFPSTDD